MEFCINNGSITFEFIYKNYTINFADYLINGQAEGKISILIQKNGHDLSSKTVERLADYMMGYMKGVTCACNNIIEVAPQPNDQVMYYLMIAIDLIIPN